MPLRHLLAAAVLGAALLAPAPAPAKPARCKSADLRYPFKPGGPKTFGVFRLRIRGGSCKTAHSVAKAWQDSFESALSHGKVKLPKSVDGFTFKTLPATKAQTYNEKGTRGEAVIRFDYTVP